MTISDLTDTQLERLDFNIWNRMGRGGGTMFGIDRRTMRAIHPGLLTALDSVREERERRNPIRKAS